MTKIKKIIITKPKTDKPFDLGEMLFVDERGIVTKFNKDTKKVEVFNKVEKKTK